MKYVFIIIAVLISIGVITAVSSYKNNRKLKQFLRLHYGEKPVRKYNKYDMKSIASYWQYRKNTENPLFAVDDLTWKDLDLDKAYMRINSACSSVGEEYLYNVLRDQAYDEKKLSETERIVKFFDEHPEERLYAQFYLSKLGKVTSNGMMEFLFNPADKTLRYYGIYPALSVAAVLSLVTLTINSTVGVYFVLTMLIINMLVYYKTKFTLEAERVSMCYITSLVAYAQKLSGMKSVELEKYADRLSKLYAALKKIGKLAGTILNKSSSDLDFLVEYFRIFFMLDFVMYNRVISTITKHSEECKEIYKIVGFLDMAISVASYRRSLAYYSVPEFSESNEVEISEIVHPLLAKPVANTITLKRSSLFTGSNASGKSTFVKAVAINSIFAQTIHTCLARRFSMKPSFVVTSMAVSDSIETGDSYYIAEIKSLKRVLDGLNKNLRCLCFIDEILKGTNTIERIAASAAILDYLSGRNCIAVAATHDIELTEMMDLLFDNYHFQEHISDNGIDFDYKIYEGGATTKNAIRLLESMDYDNIIITKANELAREFENNRAWHKLGSTSGAFYLK